MRHSSAAALRATQRFGGRGTQSSGAAALPTTLATLDFRSPSYFANAATGGWMTKPAAASKGWRWKCNEASGNISDDMSGDGVALVKSGVAYYQKWTPLIQSGGFTRVGLELSGTDCYFAESSNTPLDLTTETFGAAGWFRYNGTAGGVILGKRTAVGLNGYQLMLEGSTGRLYWNLCDGTSRGPFYIWASGLLVPGTWNFFSTVVNRTTNLATGFLNGAQKDSADIAALTGSVTSATPFRIGSTADPVAWYPGAFSELMFWKGGAMTLAEHQAIYANAFSDPNDGLTYTRAGTVAYEVAYSANPGIALCGFSANQFPFAREGALEDGANGGGLGLPVHGVITNKCLQSEDPATTWTTSNLAVSAGKDYAPNGSYTAKAITAADSGGYLKQTFLSIPATTHTFSFYIRGNGVNAPGSVRIYKNSTSTERARTNFTAWTNNWLRQDVTATVDLNDCSVWIVLDNIDDSALVWGMQLTETAEWPGLYVPTTTAAAACSAPTITVTTPSGFLLGAMGTIDATILPTYTAQPAAGAILEGNNASSQILLERTTGEAIRLLVKDGAGASQVDASTTAATSTKAVHVAQGRFHATSAAYSSKHGDAGVSDTRVGDGVANWTSVDPSAIGVGCLSGGTAHLNGIIELVEVYR